MTPYYRAWAAHARCAGAERDWELLEPQEFIKLFCSQCPVRRQCFQEGFENQYWGVWGGTTKEWRDVLIMQYTMLMHSGAVPSPMLVSLIEQTLTAEQLME